MIETEIEFAIRPYDVDMAGIVSNIVYVRWLEDLRVELFGKYIPARDMAERNLLAVVVRTEIDYRASLRYLDRCTGHIALVRLGRTSATLKAVFRKSHRTSVVEATQVCVLTDTTTGKAVPLPEDVRALLESNPSARE